MGRRRPGSQLAAAAKPKPEAPKPVAPAFLPGWQDAEDAKRGPKYRAAFLDQRRGAVMALEEDLKRDKAQAQRAERRLAQLRKALEALEKGLAQPPRAAPDAPPRPTTEWKPKAAASAAPLAPQCCAVCGAQVPDAQLRFCLACLPGVLEEASALREELAPVLLEKATLRGRLERQQEALEQLEQREGELGARLAAHDPEAEREARDHFLELLSQLRATRMGKDAGLAAKLCELFSVYLAVRDAPPSVKWLGCDLCKR